MNVNFLLDFINPVVMGICLCAGYAFKKAFSSFPNRFIPLGVAIIGTILSCVVNAGIDANIVLSGMISGLASTGCYELLRNLIKGDK